jgi:ABC-2 type transport system ATP-binding protein
MPPTAPTSPRIGPASDDTADPVVELRDIGHTFGRTEALRHLDLRVPRTRITVLLGPNGAGKTTAIRVITGALVPLVGSVTTFGLDPDREGHLVRPRCGVVSAKPALYDRLSGRDNLLYSAELYGLGRDIEPRLREVAGRFGIADALEDAVGGYSTGMKTRLALARSVLHDPELLLFDEPTSGLDPESSHAVLELIREMTRDGCTVVMCTHLLAEAEGLADHVVMMEGGTDMIAGSPDELTRRFWPHPIVRLDAEDPRLLDRIAGWPGVAAYRRDPSGARIELDDIARLPDMVASLVADGLRLTRVDPHEPTLEDLYFTIRRQRGGLTTEASDQLLEPVSPGWTPRDQPVPPTSARDPFAEVIAPHGVGPGLAERDPDDTTTMTANTSSTSTSTSSPTSTDRRSAR